jgi:hypothetical protein
MPRTRGNLHDFEFRSPSQHLLLGLFTTKLDYLGCRRLAFKAEHDSDIKSDDSMA